MIIRQTTTIVFEYPQDYLQEQEWCKTKDDRWIHKGTDTLGAVYENQISYSIGVSADRKTENSSEKPNNCEPQTEVETMSCAECKHRPIGAEICEEACHYEPQTDWHYDEQDATWYPYKHEDEPQQKSCATCKHALGNWDGESNNCGRCCGADRRFYEPKTESQTERSE